MAVKKLAGFKKAETMFLVGQDMALRNRITIIG